MYGRRWGSAGGWTVPVSWSRRRAARQKQRQGAVKGCESLMQKETKEGNILLKVLQGMRSKQTSIKIYSNQDSLVLPLYTAFFDDDWFKQKGKPAKRQQNQRNNSTPICSFSSTPPPSCPPSFQLPSGISGAPINSAISIKKLNTAHRISHAYIAVKLGLHILPLQI